MSQESANGTRINNERLEFLGDAILDAVTADFLFKTFPTKDEGFLTEMRSKLVSRATLNKLSQKLGFDHLIQLDP
ncbi:MAG TPA: ribonuclease III domain-containing protein, partial [Nitrospirota bacterium]